MDPVELQRIQDLAKEIAEKGAAGDPVTVLLAKGMSDAVGKLGELAAMALGKGKTPPKDGDGDGKVDSDGDGADDDPAGGDDAPGYEDMNLGAPATPTGDSVLDVTAFVFKTGATVEALAKSDVEKGKQIGELITLVKAQAGQIETLGKMLATATDATTAILVPLAKALVEQRAIELDTPAPALTPRRLAPAKPTTADAAFIGGNKLVETRTLAKALTAGLISTEAKQAFFRTRRFSDQDGENATTRAKLEDLSKTIPAPR